MMAQIDIGGLVDGGLGAASEAGVVISTLFFLALLVLCVGWVAWLIIGNLREARAVTKAEKEAERTARAEERKATADALKDATHTNRELLDRLERLTETQEQMVETHKQSNTNQESLTGSIEKLMTAIENGEDTRAQRYAELFKQRAEDHQAVVDVTEALQGVKNELAGLKEGVDTLKESVESKIGLTESDRNRINELVEKTTELLTRIEENENAKATDHPSPAAADAASAGATDAGADAGGHA